MSTEISKPAFTTTENGELALNSLSEQLAFAKNLIEKGLVSPTFKNEQALVLAFQMAKSLNIAPLVAIKNCYVVGNKPSFFGDLPLAVCQASGNFQSIEEFSFDKEMKRICFDNGNLGAPVEGAVCRVWRKGDPVPAEEYFTMSEAGKAGLVGSQTWQKYAKTMLKMRARSAALKVKFADSLNGMSIMEYDHDELPDTFVGKNEAEKDRTESLNAQYSTVSDGIQD